MRLLRDGHRPLRIAHRGTAGEAPENSLRAVAAALAHGVDVVEVDVSEVGGRLVLAHSPGVADEESPLLGEALAFFCEQAAPEAGIQLDVKPRRGAEARLVEAVRAAGLLERTFVSSTFSSVLREVQRLEPALPTAIGYPYDRGNLAASGLLPGAVVTAALRAMKAALPLRVGRMVGGAGADAASLYHHVLSPAVVRRCHEQGVAVIAWTVNDRRDLERVLEAGVDGVVTDDPSLLGL